MIALILAVQMKRPVWLEVSIGPQRTQTEHRFGPVERPPRPGALHAVLHQVATRPLDDARADGIARGEILVIAQHIAVLQEIVCTLVHRRPLAGVERAHGGAAPLGLLTDEPQLVFLPVDENDPGPLALGVAPARLVEHLGNDGAGLFAHARPHALALWLRAALFADFVHRCQLAHHVVGATHMRRDAVDGGDRRHTLTVALLALGEARVQLVCAGLRGFARLRAEGLFAHRYPLAIGGQDHESPGGVGLRGLRLRAALLIESIEVLRGPLTQRLSLAFGHLCPGVLHDGLHHLLEAAARSFHGDFLAQGVGILFLGQIQRRVERVQARLACDAIAESLDLHRAEEALQLAAVQAPLGAPHPVLARQRRPDVPYASALQPALQELTEDLPALPFEEIFGLTVCQPRSGRREQLLDKVFKFHTGLVELILYSMGGDMHPRGPPGEWPTVFFTTTLPQSPLL